MDLDLTFPYRVCLSLPWRTDRRASLVPRLKAAGIHNVNWFHGVSPNLLRDEARGFRDTARRSCALGKRFILRIARQKRASSVLFFEDDVVFHPMFSALLKKIDLPEDWGLFYFGCLHVEPPVLVSPGVAKVARALDNHAVAIKSDYFNKIRTALRGTREGIEGFRCGDALISRLHKIIPTYAAYPNLAWQTESYSDLRKKEYSGYYQDGRQKRRREVLRVIEYQLRRSYEIRDEV